MINIFISAGHYPTKPGACYEGFCEYDEAIKWAESLTEVLNDFAVLVPTGVLREKISFIKRRSPTIAIEIHFNYAPDGPDADNYPEGRGSETLYYPGSVKGELLAKCIQDELGITFPPNRGIKEGYYQMDKSKGPDFFLTKTPCPAVIVEPEFIYYKNLIQMNREKGVRSIANGIFKYLNEEGLL